MNHRCLDRPAVGGVVPSSLEWSCPRCTLYNPISSQQCEACYYQRTPPPLPQDQNHRHAPTSAPSEQQEEEDEINVQVQQTDPRWVAAATTLGSFAALGGLVGGPVGAVVGGVVGGVMGLRMAAATRFHMVHSNGSTVRVIQSNNGRHQSVTIRHHHGRSATTDRLILQMLLLNAMNQGITNPDHMSYDELLERFGVGTENQRRGASPEQIESLPLATVADEKEPQLTCNICLEDFQKGDEIRKLPHCSHTFHKQCIDRWLSQVASCPICKKELDRTASTNNTTATTATDS
mmetsp:Transcript_14830/g.22656  ORF Transcript_14830/g.22656 Transcript_14830/m.22656 type:complete len:291 (-) Transcript_14830:189-1061(-)